MEQEEVFEGERRDYRTDGKKWQNEAESRCEGGKVANLASGCISPSDSCWEK